MLSRSLRDMASSTLSECLSKTALTSTHGDRHGSNALQEASGEGYLEIVQILLEKDADIDAQGGYYGTALQAASYGGHLDVVQFLLEQGADINVQGGRYYGNALQAASYGGYLEIVQILLAKGADINAQGGYYGNALQAALV